MTEQANWQKVYRAIHEEVQSHLRMIDGIDDVRPVWSDEDVIASNGDYPGVRAYLARQAAARGDAYEAIKRVVQIMQPGYDADHIALSRLNGAAEAAYTLE